MQLTNSSLLRSNTNLSDETKKSNPFHQFLCQTQYILIRAITRSDYGYMFLIHRLYGLYNQGHLYMTPSTTYRQAIPEPPSPFSISLIDEKGAERLNHKVTKATAEDL